MTVGTSEAGGVLGRVGAGICEATGCCDSGCGADNASVLKEREKSHKQGRMMLENRETSNSRGTIKSFNHKINDKNKYESKMLVYYSRPTYLFGSAGSCLLAHPVPSLGTSETLGSLPLFSAFRLGRLAGGGIRRAEATLPRDCRPWRGGTDMGKRKEVISTDGPLKPDTSEIYWV